MKQESGGKQKEDDQDSLKESVNISLQIKE